MHFTTNGLLPTSMLSKGKLKEPILYTKASQTPLARFFLGYKYNKPQSFNHFCECSIGRLCQILSKHQRPHWFTWQTWACVCFVGTQERVPGLGGLVWQAGWAAQTVVPEWGQQTTSSCSREESPELGKHHLNIHAFISGLEQHEESKPYQVTTM